MSTEDVSVGEGFAFFRWHSLRWAGGLDICRYRTSYVCFRLWRDHDR